MGWEGNGKTGKKIEGKRIEGMGREGKDREVSARTSLFLLLVHGTTGLNI